MKCLPMAALGAALLFSAACERSPAEPADPPSAVAESELTAGERGFLVSQGVDLGALRFRFRLRMSRVPLLTMDAGEEVGRSRLVRLPRGVLATVWSKDLEPGTATTLWMVVFNAPEHCSDGGCGVDDLGNPDVRADVVWVDGAVVGRSGRARYRAYTREGDTRGSIAEALLGLPARGLEDARASEIHYVIRTHGPALDGLVREMVTTFNGGCQRARSPTTRAWDRTGRTPAPTSKPPSTSRDPTLLRMRNRP